MDVGERRIDLHHFRARIYPEFTMQAIPELLEFHHSGRTLPGRRECSHKASDCPFIQRLSGAELAQMRQYLAVRASVGSRIRVAYRQLRSLNVQLGYQRMLLQEFNVIKGVATPEGEGLSIHLSGTSVVSLGDGVVTAAGKLKQVGNIEAAARPRLKPVHLAAIGDAVVVTADTSWWFEQLPESADVTLHYGVGGCRQPVRPEQLGKLGQTSATVGTQREQSQDRSLAYRPEIDGLTGTCDGNRPQNSDCHRGPQAWRSVLPCSQRPESPGVRGPGQHQLIVLLRIQLQSFGEPFHRAPPGPQCPALLEVTQCSDAEAGRGREPALA
jgi:hypothetical protein